MIISASRRTDIPAFYSKWFLNRIKEGFVLVPNPRNPNHISKIDLSPDKIDCIVFWTKNPYPMMRCLDELNKLNYLYYFEFTLNSYGKEIEKNLPDKEKIINTFKELSSRLGQEHVDWRFDPVIVNEKFTIEWHLEHFYNICRQLYKYTNRSIISFIDHYRHLESKFIKPKDEDIYKLAEGLFKISKEFNLTLFTCSEQIDLRSYGIEHAACIDKNKIEKLTGYLINAKKDPGQRKICNCVESIDIGIYNTCSHGCLYCYATTSGRTALMQMKNHNPDSPMLTGFPKGTETITSKTSAPQNKNQKLLFE